MALLRCFPTNPWQKPKESIARIKIWILWSSDSSPNRDYVWSPFGVNTKFLLGWSPQEKPSKNTNPLETLSNSFQIKFVNCFQLHVCQLTSHKVAANMSAVRGSWSRPCLRAHFLHLRRALIDHLPATLESVEATMQWGDVRRANLKKQVGSHFESKPVNCVVNIPNWEIT